VRITGRQAMGVTLLRLSPGEHVTAVFPVMEDAAEDAPENGATGEDDGNHGPGGPPPSGETGVEDDNDG
jgi:DNA gyrase subunit A